MARILITGATGNVGIALLKAFSNQESNASIYAGVRSLEKDRITLSPYKVSCVEVNFDQPESFRAAFENCDILFLLRPPQLSDVKKYITPLLTIAKETGVQHIVFLSVQGVEKSSIIPHHTIEKLIQQSAIHYTFIRPAYFMQNFTTTLLEDLRSKKLIFLPAGNAKFTIIDVEDIGKVAAKVLLNPSLFQNKAFDLTNEELLSFEEMAEQLSQGLGLSIRYESPSLFRFFLQKRKEKMPVAFILVMIMLHYFPRFQKTPPLTFWVEKIAGQKPKRFGQFIKDNKSIIN